MIYTIYKLIPKNDPSNYRGTTPTSCLGKLALFCILGQRLTYKHKEFGLTVNPLEIIKTICATPKVSDLYERKISQTFSPKIGLKQGDVLSTLLFNHK